MGSRPPVMRALTDAQTEVLDAIPTLPSVRVSIWEALGTCTAETILAPSDVPPFANSAMDGYAVLASDTVDPPNRLRVVDAVAAGHVSSHSVEPGATIQIMTGAPMPVGADAVVRVEDTLRDGDTVRIDSNVASGTSVRLAGSDIGAGATLVDAGARLTPAHVALLATAGVSTPLVHGRPRVGVLSTGDEVKSPETARLEPGWIRDANRPLLVGLLAEVGAEIADFGIIPDDADGLRATLKRAAADCDVVVTSGGVSMGEFDLVKQILAEIGGVDLWRVAMQPAKPFAFGSIGSTPFFGLPGNPVSVFVSFEQFLRPALLTMMGATEVFRPRVTGRAASSWESDPEKDVFTRVEIVWESDGPVVTLAGGGGQGSHVLSTMVSADAFAVVPRGIGSVQIDDRVVLEMYRWPASRTRQEALGG